MRVAFFMPGFFRLFWASFSLNQSLHPSCKSQILAAFFLKNGSRRPNFFKLQCFFYKLRFKDLWGLKVVSNQRQDNTPERKQFFSQVYSKLIPHFDKYTIKRK